MVHGAFTTSGLPSSSFVNVDCFLFCVAHLHVTWLEVDSIMPHLRVICLAPTNLAYDFYALARE